MRKLEVGDVWDNLGIKINLCEQTHKERGVRWWKVLRCDLEINSIGCKYQYLTEKTILKYYTYLGKAKANINDLFEVEIK